MTFETDYVVKILLAFVLGGLLGAEREARDKSAGFRTIILICVGSTLFTMLSLLIAKVDDPSRIAANIVVGIGFLGAGAIIRQNEHVSGLTTAATIWLAAAIGLAVGSGYYLLAALVTLLTLVVLWAFPSFEMQIGKIRHIITYRLVCAPDFRDQLQLESIFTQHGMKLYSKKRSKQDEKLIFVWEAFGTAKAHDEVIDSLLKDERILELTY